MTWYCWNQGSIPYPSRLSSRVSKISLDSIRLVRTRISRFPLPWSISSGFTRMAQHDLNSLWDLLVDAGHLAGRSIRGAASSANLDDLVRGSSLGGRLGELRDRSVLIATKDQLST